MFRIIFYEQDKIDWTARNIYEELEKIKDRFDPETVKIGLILNEGDCVFVTINDELAAGMIYDYMRNGVIDEKNIDTNF